MNDILIAIVMFLVIYHLLFENRKVKRLDRRFKRLGRDCRSMLKTDMKIIKYLYRLTKKLFMFTFKRDLYNFNKSIGDLEQSICSMQPREFEVFCAKLFKRDGYSVELTQASNDYGRDIIIEKDGFISYIECKRWSKKTGHAVGREICEKLMGACISGKNVKRGIIINTGRYHENAYEYCNRINSHGDFELELWSEKDLINLYKKTFKDKKYYEKSGNVIMLKKG